MKIFCNVLKVLAALATVAGVVYVVATYGDKIVAWVKQLWNKVSCCGGSCCCEASEEISAEEIVEEVPVAEDAVQAEDKDFEG